jgi:hypothetical protein
MFAKSLTKMLYYFDTKYNPHSRVYLKPPKIIKYDKK